MRWFDKFVSNLKESPNEVYDQMHEWANQTFSSLISDFAQQERSFQQKIDNLRQELEVFSVLFENYSSD